MTLALDGGPGAERYRAAAPAGRAGAASSRATASRETASKAASKATANSKATVQGGGQAGNPNGNPVGPNGGYYGGRYSDIASPELAGRISRTILPQLETVEQASAWGWPLGPGLQPRPRFSPRLVPGSPGRSPTGFSPVFSP